MTKRLSPKTFARLIEQIPKKDFSHTQFVSGNVLKTGRGIFLILRGKDYFDMDGGKGLWKKFWSQILQNDELFFFSETRYCLSTENKKE